MTDANSNVSNEMELPASGAFHRQPEFGEGPSVARRIETRPSDIKSLAILKLDHRGDFIMATDAFRKFRADFRTARLTLICGPWNKAAAEALNIFDAVIPFAAATETGQASSLSRPALKQALRALLDGRHFDLAVDLRLDQDTRDFLAEMDADHRAGFGTSEQFPFLDIALPLFSATWAQRAEQWIFLPTQFEALQGKHRGNTICLAESKRVARGFPINPWIRAGRRFGLRRLLKPSPRQAWSSDSILLIKGPWAQLQRGNYTAQPRIEALAGPLDLFYELCVTHKGRVETIGSGDIIFADGKASGIDFSLPADVVSLELRLWNRTRDLMPFRFGGLYLRKYGRPGDFHQSEAFAMLEALVRTRMTFPMREQNIPIAPHG